MASRGARRDALCIGMLLAMLWPRCHPGRFWVEPDHDWLQDLRPLARHHHGRMHHYWNAAGFPCQDMARPAITWGARLLWLWRKISDMHSEKESLRATRGELQSSKKEAQELRADAKLKLGLVLAVGAFSCCWIFPLFGVLCRERQNLRHSLQMHTKNLAELQDEHSRQNARLRHTQRVVEPLNDELAQKRTELRAAEQKIDVLTRELSTERSMSEMLKVEGPIEAPEGDLPFHVHDEMTEAGVVRTVAMTCPGVVEELSVESIVNGCTISIRTREILEPPNRDSPDPVDIASIESFVPRVGAFREITKTIQFHPSTGLFEFRADESKYDENRLQLTFGECRFEGRSFWMAPNGDLRSGRQVSTGFFHAD